MHDRKRAYAADASLDGKKARTKLEEAAAKVAELEGAQAAHARAAAAARWRWAVERITNGAILCRAVRPPAADAAAER